MRRNVTHMLRLVAASIPVEYSSMRITVGFPAFQLHEKDRNVKALVRTNECYRK